MKKILFLIVILIVTFFTVLAIEESTNPENEILPEPSAVPTETVSPLPEENTPEPSKTPDSDDEEPEATATPEETPSPEPTSTPEPEKEYAEIIVDTLENFDMINDHSTGVIYDNVADAETFYGDSTIMQRTDKKEQYIEYEVPYWCEAEITAYFYTGEDINHFIFKSGEAEIEADTEITSEAGKWHMVVYKISNPNPTEKSFRILWQDLSDTDFTNWGQALGNVKIFIDFSKACKINYLSETIFPVPDSAETEYALNADVTDQDGKVIEADIIWVYEAETSGVSFDEETKSLTVSSDTADEAEIVLKLETEGIEPHYQTISFKTYKPGDINGDFVIDETDFDMAVKDYYKQTENRGDINKNGIIDIYDLAYIKKNITNEELSE